MLPYTQEAAACAEFWHPQLTCFSESEAHIVKKMSAAIGESTPFSDVLERLKKGFDQRYSSSNNRVI